jgi:hypothetical protein
VLIGSKWNGCQRSQSQDIREYRMLCVLVSQNLMNLEKGRRTGIVDRIGNLVHDVAGCGRVSIVVLSPGMTTCVPITGGNDPVTRSALG